MNQQNQFAMKQKTLLFFVMILLITTTFGQRNRKQESKENNFGYAITAAEKGGHSWKEVKLVNIVTGEELQSVYNSKQEIEALNARTGKPIAKKSNDLSKTNLEVQKKKVVNLDQELNSTRPQEKVQVYHFDDSHVRTLVKTEVHNVVIYRSGVIDQSDKPFATNSAAMAYDKKHERLYYTPMGINQLRYIELNAKSPKVYYFEDEAFGTVANSGDAPNQITRMVIASDGNGYALTNDGNHLIRFTTGKKPVITDLGALTDDAANAKFSVHSRGGFGGDMIADKDGNLYLIQANRNVFRFGIENKTAKYLGTIKGLPQGFSTNGAMVEEGSKVIIASSESTVGYYRFDLLTMQAEKVSTSPNVFNASDLANGNLAFDKKKKKDKKEEAVEPVKEEVTDATEKTQQVIPDEVISDHAISVFPNPVTNSRVKVSFDNIPAGKYQVQVVDLAGKLVSNQQVNVATKGQVTELRLPRSLTAGTYLVKVSNEANQVSTSAKILVQN